MFGLPAFAEAQPVVVRVNGDVRQTPVEPQIVNDRTMLPMRSIFESPGATVTWMEADQMIFATKDDCMIVMQIGQNKMSVRKIGSDENVMVELDAAPFIYEDSTLVPARAIAEALEAKVTWTAETRTADIATE